MQELIGRKLGQYKIVEQIGRGGMATVFKARQQGLERWVAIKVMPPQYAADPDFNWRFLREAQAIAQLEHPHILPVYDFGQQGETTYLVMRYIEDSHSLADVMRRSIPLDQALFYLDQVAAALDYAHARGIIHRDVKPANILLDQDWVFLADFGLARLMAGIETTGVGSGSPAYMSPEQGVGGKLDARTDVYALGVIVFQMLTGRIPHLAEHTQAIIYKRNHEPAPSLRELRPDLPRSIEQVVQTALAPAPARRFASAGAFITALRQAVQEAQAGSMPTAPVSPPGRPLPIEPSAPPPVARSSGGFLWLVMGLLLLTLVVVLIGGLVGFMLRAANADRAAVFPTTVVVAPTATTVPATPVPAATPTAPAAISTPTSQTCTLEPGSVWAGVWADYRDQLGCPVGEQQTISTIAEESFQGGHLFWRRDTDQVYIIYDREQGGEELSEGRWQLVPPDWKWDGSNPEGVGLSPPPGLVEPKRGFGWLWRTHLGGPNGPLGWALDREYGFDEVGQAQPFEEGLLFKGSGSKVYILLDNGRFYSR